MDRVGTLGHLFPGYTWPVIMALPYEVWVQVAINHDELLEASKQQGRG